MKSCFRTLLTALLCSAAVILPLRAQQQPVMTVSMTQVAVLTNGNPPAGVAFLDLTNVGAFYSVAPTVAIAPAPPGGTDATAVATISLAGVVSNVFITNPGAGYTSPPTVTFSAPTPPAGQLGITATATAYVGTPFVAPFQNESFGNFGVTIAMTAISTGTFPVGGYTDAFFVDGNSIGVAVTHPPSGSPASVAWAPPQPGSYFLTVVSSDGLGHTATSLPVRYFAIGTAITSPTPNTIVPNGSSVVIQATATPQPLTGGGGNNAFVSRMDFYADGVLVGTDSTAPYSLIYTPSNPPTPNAPTTRHIVETRAFDNNGNQISANGTATLNLFMVPPIGTPPTCVISSPANNAILPIPSSASGDIPIAVSAGTGTGLITKVELYIDGVLFGTGTTFPYSFTWHPTVVGTYHLIALAYDDKSNVVASSVAPASTTLRIAASPTVTVIAPVAGATVGAGVPTTLTAAATDSNVVGGGVAKVQFFAGGTFVGESTTPTGNQYSFTWTPPSAGSAGITALAINNLGLSALSSAVTVNVSSGGGGGGGGPIGIPPTVSITSPAASTQLPVNKSVLITGSATDTDGNIVSVQFFVNNQSVGITTTYPYTASWTPVSLGSYAITAKAADNDGNAVTSAAVQVTVSAGGSIGNPPTVSVTSPATGTQLPVNNAALITATAADTDGNIDSVQFFVNGVPLSTDTSFPYSTTWTPTAPGIYTLLARATDNSGNITNSATVTITVAAGAAPTVALTNPLAGSSYVSGTALNLAATAADADGTVAQVQFFVNNVAQGSADTAAPYSTTWTPPSAGTYNITAQATDNSGNIATSTAITVTITSNGAPTVSLVSPANGATESAGTPVTLTASAADADGTITSVRFLANGTQVAAAATTVPFSATWTPTAAGSYTIVAEATDNSGNVTSSAPRTISVIANQPPTVALTSPSNNSSLPAGEPITVTATASDSDGTIASVRFLVNGNVLIDVTGTSVFKTPPYTITWKPTITGSYSLVAEATDNLGNIGDSVARTVTIVANQPPNVTLTSPTSGFSTTLGLPVNFAATASDSDGTVASVRFLVNGNGLIDPVTGKPLTFAAAPYAVSVVLTTAGTYSVVAEATDDVGNVSTSTPATVTIVPNSPPAVALTTPGNGSVIRVGTINNLTATATDSDGTIASVQFFVNGTPIGAPATTAPFTTAWTPVAEGIYRLTATTFDNLGATAASSTITVLAVSAATGGGDTVYTGTFFGIGETGKFAVINMGGKNAAFIGYSTAGAGKVYFYSGIPVDAAHGFTLTDPSGHTFISGRVDDTAAVITTLDGAPITLIGIVAFPSGNSVASGYYTGSLAGRTTSQLAAIVGADGSIMLYAADGAFRTAGAGTVDNTGAFKNIPASSGGVFTGKADPATGFLSGNLTGPTPAGFMGAVESGVSFSDGFLRNLSTRGQVGAGGNVLIAGFVVGGTEKKNVLIRAIGPSLTQFGITGALADPQLQLFSGTALVASNNNWGGSTALFDTFNSVGAFLLAPASLDSVLFVNLVPGAYTAQVSGVNGATGIALVELYDADNPAPFSPQKVMNVSTRGVVGPGQAQLIAGFVVSGTTAKRVLIRAAGPSLAPYVLAGTSLLADPVLRLIRVSDNLVIRENDNWEVGNDATLITDASAKVGAFPFGTGSKDAALLLSLPPGTYSAQVSGTGTTTGVALVEVYEVP